ncbi:hypothetical protein PT274_02210 [Leuconostocaceae bacterium ESL0958]|nr:hypothetical protein [Leuconostocaceae bacterium ESL0958]
MGQSTYHTAYYDCLPVAEIGPGQYQPLPQAAVHQWRIGKHTKGRFQGPGQIALTEKKMRLVILAEHPLKFKDRHDYQPLGRFTKETMPLPQSDTK